MGFPEQKHCTDITGFYLLGEECGDPAWEGENGKEACTWIPLDFTCVFFHYDQAVCPYCIAVINVSHEYNYMLGFVRPYSKSPNERVVLELPRHNIVDGQYLKLQ